MIVSQDAGDLKGELFQGDDDADNRPFDGSQGQTIGGVLKSAVWVASGHKCI